MSVLSFSLNSPPPTLSGGAIAPVWPALQRPLRSASARGLYQQFANSAKYRKIQAFQTESPPETGKKGSTALLGPRNSWEVAGFCYVNILSTSLENKLLTEKAPTPFEVLLIYFINTNSHVVKGIKDPYASRQHAKLKIFKGGNESQKYPLKMVKFTLEPMNQAWKECMERCTPGCVWPINFQRLKEVKEKTGL